MSIVVKALEQKYDFAPQSLYKSNEFCVNGNIYLIIGPGSEERFVSAVRLVGSKFEYADNFLKSCLVPFEGEVIISNGDK